jgi:hypothetical protein
MHVFNQQGKELDIDHVDVQTVKLAGWLSLNCGSTKFSY